MCEDGDMDIASENEIKNTAQGWTDAHKDVDGKNSTIYHPYLAVTGDSGTSQEGIAINPGLVVDVDAARDIANVQNEQGVSAGVAREAELQRQAETGLTASERDNIEFMNGVKDKGGDGVIEMTDDKGRKMQILYPIKYGETGSVYLTVLNQSGAYTIDLGPIGGAEKYPLVNWTAMNDFLNEIDSTTEDRGYGKTVYIDKVVDDKDIKSVARSDRFSVSKFNFSSNNSFEFFKSNLASAKERGKKAKELGEKAKEALNVKTLIDRL